METFQNYTVNTGNEDLFASKEVHLNTLKFISWIIKLTTRNKLKAEHFKTKISIWALSYVTENINFSFSCS